eukprot:TRINITY_DN3816_c0_g1_i1.p1 TRINITY_DN3816_c0_g1~~TRINITY_DN3816_c0_g1_i1.p1  ORF type:complete len:285 (+),score=54.64 TRINITY_DN3816_c0_g1_i1:1241-2095(+)
MLSGIGEREELESHGIECVVDLPGVGKNLRDHVLVMDLYNTTKVLGYNLETTWETYEILKYKLFKTGPAMSSALEGTGFFRTKPELDRPDLQLHVFPGLPFHGFKEKLNLKDLDTGFPNNEGFSICPTLLHPKSIGSISLNSNDPFDHPIIDANYLDHEDDYQTLLAGFEIVNKIVQQEPLSEVINAHYVDKDILYPPGSQEYLREYIKKYLLTVYHPVGTCKMGIDSMSVVDPTLKVYGISGLRVADCSIMPTLVSGNTNAPAMMIGEKASVLIRQDSLRPKL